MNWKASSSQSRVAFRAQDDVILKSFSTGGFDKIGRYAKFTCLFTETLSNSNLLQIARQLNEAYE